MNPFHFDFRYGFWVDGSCNEARQLVDAAKALAGYAACDELAEVGREAYLSAFQFAGDFAEHLKRTGSPKGFAGACWTKWLWLDIDRDGDLPSALADARKLATAAVESLGVAEDDVLAFYSGAKGYHVGLPTATWAPQPGPLFHRISKHVAEALAERAGVGIDVGVYATVQCLRAPNSRHPRTGLHKRRLTFNELMHLSPERIVALAATPEPFDIPQPTYQSEPAAQLWRDATEHAERESEAKAKRLAEGNGTAALNRATLDYIRTGAAVGDRDRLLYSSSANLAELGAPLPLCVALLTEAALDVGLKPSEVRREIQNGWASVQPGIREVCAAVSGEVLDVTTPDAGKGGAS